MEDLGSALSGAHSGAQKFRCFAALWKTESWSDGFGSKAAVIYMCYFMSPVRLSSRNGSSSSNTVTQSIYLSWASFTVLLGYNFRVQIGYPEKDTQKQRVVGVLFKAIEWTRALAPRYQHTACLCVVKSWTKSGVLFSGCGLQPHGSVWLPCLRF